MTPPLRWARWTAMAGGAVAAAAFAGLVFTTRRANVVERRAADAGNAAAVAGYLSLVTPVEPNGGDYQLPALLSAANTLASARGWNAGLQVAWRGAPLLHDRIGLTPLDAATAALLGDGYTAAYVRRYVGDIALAPLLDRDRWNSVGWVAVWRSVPPDPISPTALDLGRNRGGGDAGVGAGAGAPGRSERGACHRCYPRARTNARGTGGHDSAGR